MIRLLRCNGESAGAGGLINSGDTMLFLGMINGSNMMLLSGHGWTDQRQRHNSSSLGWLMVQLITCGGKSACAGGLIDGGNTMLFLGMINSGNTTLLLSGRRWTD
jgi:hypothetical protein